MTDEPNAVEVARQTVCDKSMRSLGIGAALDVLIAAVRAEERERATVALRAEVERLGAELYDERHAVIAGAARECQHAKSRRRWIDAIAAVFPPGEDPPLWNDVAQAEQHMRATLARLVDEEQARWQNGIAELLALHDALTDGAGCDSGDPLDFSLAQIRNALGAWEDECDETREERDSLRTDLARAVEATRAEERERAATIADEYESTAGDERADTTGVRIGALIRAQR